MRRNEDNKPWGLIVALCLAGAAGLLSLPLQVITVRSLNAASAADVERAALLTEQLAQQQREDVMRAQAYREDSRLLLLSICDQIESVSAQAKLKVPPCPRVATNPAALMPTPPMSGGAPGANGGTSLPSATP